MPTDKPIPEISQPYRVLYLTKGGMSGWYWTERYGNRTIYTGAYRTEEDARRDMELHKAARREES